MMIDKHTLALISIVGNCLDVLGALCLAYDVLGGEHGAAARLRRGPAIFERGGRAATGGHETAGLDVEGLRTTASR